MDEVLNFFANSFNGLVWLVVMLVAMLPVFESKVAIPFGSSAEIWGQAALHPAVSAVFAFIGSMIPVIIILLFLKPVFTFLKSTKWFKRIAEFFENMFQRRADQLKEEKTDKKNNIIKALTIMFFCAIPLPLAGVWMSAAIAVFCGMKFWPAMLVIALGNLIDITIVTVLCIWFIDSVWVLLLITLIFVAIYAAVMLGIYLRKNKLKKEKITCNVK